MTTRTEADPIELSAATYLAACQADERRYVHVSGVTPNGSSAAAAAERAGRLIVAAAPDCGAAEFDRMVDAVVDYAYCDQRATDTHECSTLCVGDSHDHDHEAAYA